MPTPHVDPPPVLKARRRAVLDVSARLDGGRAFDGYTRLAAAVCGTPLAQLTSIARDPLRLGELTGAGDGVVEIGDTLLDGRFAAHPLAGDRPVRFYAGVALHGTNGARLGTLSVIDFEPRALTVEQRSGLSGIAGLIVAYVERRVPARPFDDPPIAAGDTPALDLPNERLTMLTTVARTLFEALDPRALADALERGVDALTAGGTALLAAPTANGEFVLTRNLTARADALIASGALLRAAAAHDGVQVSDDGRRAAVRIAGPSGAPAFVLDLHAASRAFDAVDVFAFEVLADYLAVAIRNVELYGELESRRAAVIELNQVKNDLIAMLAHDFKGPLTTIVGLADVLAEDERFDAESRRYLGIINSSAMRLASLASDTLELSRLDQNELSMRFEPVNVVALVRDIVRVLGVTRIIDMRSATSERVVLADPARLRQVFENVIGNAIKYSPRGDTVDVIVRERPEGVEIAVRDRGIGIPAADLPKLFRRFARATNARELGIGGTGFGLYLARTIVERHGGTIGVESVEGSGSTFRVFVPAEPAPQRVRDRRILLLDAEGEGRSFIAHALRDEGYAVYPVATDHELFAALDERRYDAAIVDCDSVTGSASAFVDRVGKRTPLVRLVSVADAEPLGGHAVLRKPFLIKDLLTVLESAVADRRRASRRGSSDRTPEPT